MTLKMQMEQKGFHCAHLNCRSIYNKIDLINHLVHETESRMHVLGLSETWLTNNIPDSFINIDGYDIIRLDRSWSHNNSIVSKKGGGVMMYIRDSVSWSDENVLFLNRSENFLEIQWIEVINENCKNFIIANTYRPPDGSLTDFQDFMEAALNSVDLLKNELFIIGDLNLDFLDNKVAGVKELKLLFKQFGLMQLIKEPTRYSPIRNSCLDLICTNSNNIAKAQVCDINISDHEMVLMTRRHVKFKDKKTSFIGRSYVNYNKERFINELINMDWNPIESSDDPIFSWDFFINRIKILMDQTCPLKRFKVKVTNKPWITHELIEQIKDKDRALRKAKKSKSQDDWVRARRMRNSCHKAVRNAKANFIKNEINNHTGDPKKFWDNISSILPSNSNSSTYIKLKDQISNEIISEQKTSEYINDFFSDVGDKLASKLTDPWFYNGTTSDIILPNCQTTLEEVTALVKEIDICKSSSISYLSSKVIKDAFTALPHVLLRIFNSSLATGVVPDSWKHATIIPLKKCGNSNDVNNLRPISLLPIQGKILEKIVHNRIMEHLELNGLLDHNQGGFRANHSTTGTISKFTDKIYHGMNKGEITVATFIDLKKAFDTVNHKILLEKLDNLGVRDRNLKWIDNYLTSRSQSTLANGIISTSRIISCGVPQGSVLGPLLFLIYVNDLSSVLTNSGHYLYADDTVIFRSGSNIQTTVNLLQTDLNSFGSWCKANKLTINTKKSNYVIYGTKQKLSRIRYTAPNLQGDILQRTPSYKYLGVHIDSHLNFNVHIDNCCKIVSHKLYLLSKIRHCINEDACICIYKTMIVPLFDYGDVIYSGSSDKNLSRLQKLQNRGLRICLDVREHISRIQLHQACTTLPLKLRRNFNLRKFMFKQKDNQDIVVYREIRTRRHDALIFETCIPNLELFKKSTIYRGIIEWNNLPTGTRNIELLESFKSHQKNEMYEHLPILNGTYF